MSIAPTPLGSGADDRDVDSFAGWARRLHPRLEALHVVGYFAPETTQAYLDIGLTDFGMGYFASRSAPMGPVPPELTTATFYVFAPGLVGAYLPRAWGIASAEQVVEARWRGIEAALRRGLGAAADAPEVVEAGTLIRTVVADLVTAGRPLCAGHTRVPWPDDPLLILWHGASILREYRGDGHVAALLLAGFDPVEALVTAAAAGASRRFLSSTRGWSAEAWSAAEDRLRDRGLLDGDGTLTDEGARLRASVEAATDRAAAEPYRRLGEQGCERLAELVRPLAKRIADSGIIPARLALP